jgi:hypothetical protein
VASTIKIKRSSVAGRIPTTSDISAGELAINTKDKRIYSSNGSAVFGFTNEYLQVANASATYLTKNNPIITGTLTANGSIGSNGYYLRSTGSGIQWAPAPSGGGGGGGISVTTKALDQLLGTDTVVIGVSGEGGGGGGSATISSGDLFIGSMLLGGM